MKKYWAVIVLALAGCNDLSQEDRDAAMWQIVHYAAKRPPGVTGENRFDTEFEEYYRSVAADYKWLHLKPNNNNGYYFLISRPARSKTPMVEGIAGIFRMEKDSLIEYEEIFRMWKMPEADLDVKGKAMFDRMVAGKDLSMFYPKFSGDQYIEVPDGRFVYDKEKRTWRDTTGPELDQ